MQYLLTFIPLVVLIVVVVVVVLLIRGAVKMMWQVAEPNEALIISGFTRGSTGTTDGMDFKIVTGKGTFVIPGLQTVRALSLTLNEPELQVNCVTSQGIQVVVQGVVIFKIADSTPVIANAARPSWASSPKWKARCTTSSRGTCARSSAP